MAKKIILLMLLLSPAALMAGGRPVKAEKLVPPSIPADRPAQAELTAELRAKVKTLGLNGLKAKGAPVSRALLLLPQDRAQAGVINFEIESGIRAGVYQCEALGRGLTSLEPHAGWRSGLIDGVTIYYAPQNEADGATVPGVYDLRNISPETYDLALIDKPDAEDMVPAAVLAPDGKPRPYFSGIWGNWYPRAAVVMPVDMVWAEDSQAGTQGAGVPFFERRGKSSSVAGAARQAAQLAHNPRYYYGPYGRAGFAVHTDHWDDAAKLADPKYSGRPEAKDFRYRDTSGCVKLRPACLALLNVFISEQAALGRRVQLEARETPLLDAPGAR
jgi:hypothetical protein